MNSNNKAVSALPRVRSSGWVGDKVVVTAATIDAGNGEPQTSVIFRSGSDFVDVLVVFRPVPKSNDAGLDSSYSSVLFGGA